MLEIKDLSKLDAPLRKTLIEILEELKHFEVIVRGGGTRVKLKRIEGKSRNHIDITEIPYYISGMKKKKNLSKDICSQIIEWCLKKSRSGYYTILV